MRAEQVISLLRACRSRLREERAVILECHCHLDSRGRPIRSTLDEDEAEGRAVRRLDKLIARIDRATDALSGVPPRAR